MLRAFILILLANLTFAAIQTLVPNITVVDFDNKGYKLESSDGGYQLIVKGDGGYRVENVKEVAPGEFLVKGEYKQRFDKKVQFKIQYIAGRDGYVARYQIRSKKKKSKRPKPTENPLHVDKPDFPPDDEDEDKPVVITIAVKAECLKACVG